MRIAGTKAPSRRVAGLTPMIDVVFLLLFFFMLASRIGPGAGIVLETSGGPGDWSGPPRLLEVSERVLRLNGVAIGESDLRDALGSLMRSPDDPIILRPAADADVSRIVEVIGLLRAEGFDRVLIAE